MTPPSGFQKPPLSFRYWRSTSMSHSARGMNGTPEAAFRVVDEEATIADVPEFAK